MMKAGPELDALVAEKVMGWWASKDGALWENDGPLRSWQWRAPRVESEYKKPWAPSTDISAAWQVVEKMRTDGHGITIQSLDEGDGIFWLVSIGEAMADGCSTAPLAICLAALKAVGVEVK